jgi:hypothetical protein
MGRILEYFSEPPNENDFFGVNLRETIQTLPKMSKATKILLVLSLLTVIWTADVIVGHYHHPVAPAPSQRSLVYGVSNYIKDANHIILLGNRIGVVGTNNLFILGGWDASLPVISTKISESEFQTISNVIVRAAIEKSKQPRPQAKVVPAPAAPTNAPNPLDHP